MKAFGSEYRSYTNKVRDIWGEKIILSLMERAMLFHLWRVKYGREGSGSGLLLPYPSHGTAVVFCLFFIPKFPNPLVTGGDTYTNQKNNG